MLNRRLVLVARPTGEPSAECWREETAAVPELKDDEAVVAVELLSIDPAMRGWMARNTYAPAVPIGEVMRSIGLGTVISTRSARYPVGAKVVGSLGWQTHAIIRKGQAGVVPYDDDHPTWPLTVLGLAARTAYFGMTDIGRPNAGETVLVSSAAGTVGGIAAQIAKLSGARVIGVAGGKAKQAYVRDELGLDIALDYKASDFRDQFDLVCGEGIDVYFDNVGGELLDNTLNYINIGARIVCCGAVSEYNNHECPYGLKNITQLITRRAAMRGFLETDYSSRYREAINALNDWAKKGQLKWREEIIDGMEKAPDALIGLLRGENTGKQLVAV